MEPVRILMVEDDLAQAEIACEMMRRFKLLNQVDLVENAAQALAFLRREAPFEAAARPDLILLDLNLPGLSAIELIGRLQGDQRFAAIPLVVLSAAEPRPEEGEALRRLGKIWVTKPLSAAEYFRIVRAAPGLALAIVKRPAE